MKLLLYSIEVLSSSLISNVIVVVSTLGLFNILHFLNIYVIYAVESRLYYNIFMEHVFTC